MKPVTYRELRDLISQLNEHQLDMSVTIVDVDNAQVNCVLSTCLLQDAKALEEPDVVVEMCEGHVAPDQPLMMVNYEPVF